MKKIIGVVVASMMFANIGFAEMRLIEEKYLEGDKPNNWGYSITTVCVDGYKFVVSRNESGTISMVQFFYFERLDNKTIPAKC